MSKLCEGRIVVVTGAGRGIGRGHAFEFAKAGAKVVVNDLGAEVDGRGSSTGPAGEVVDEIRAAGGEAVADGHDVSDAAGAEAIIQTALDTYGGLDVLVNNAGVGFFKNLETMSLEEWNSILETNVTGVFLCCRSAIPRMRTRGGGYIINMSSLAGRNAFPQATAYNASKFALNGMSEALMQEVRYDGIRVSYVMPGSVNTYFNSGTPDATMSWQLQPEDIARVVVDLLAHDPRSLPSRVEIRPSTPPKK
jgi:3-oxoacyl-[acyl-carrier protein] reductase